MNISYELMSSFSRLVSGMYRIPVRVQTNGWMLCWDCNCDCEPYSPFYSFKWRAVKTDDFITFKQLLIYFQPFFSPFFHYTLCKCKLVLTSGCANDGFWVRLQKWLICAAVWSEFPGCDERSWNLEGIIENLCMFSDKMHSIFTLKEGLPIPSYSFRIWLYM